MDLIDKYKNFPELKYSVQLEIKQRGRPTPDLNIEWPATSRGKYYVRKFNSNIYWKYHWICGCEVKNRLFCFSCVLFGGDVHWTQTGVNDLVHIVDKAKQHENSKQHLINEMRLTLLGNLGIQDNAYWQNNAIHNETVTKNRYVLSKIIDAIKFCGAFELALKSYGEGQVSESSSILHGLINYTAQSDATLKKYLETTIVFKENPEEIQKDLLECIFEVYREEISSEINNANFLGIISEGTTNVYSQLQVVIVFRYIKNGKPIERFWNFFTTAKKTAEKLSSFILSELEPLVKENPNKLIAQSYDGTAVMSSREAVQTRIKEKYSSAHFLHCCAHPLNLIIAQAASQHSHQIQLFFSDLSDIAAFFANCTQRIALLNKVVGCNNPKPVAIEFNFESCTTNVVYEYRNELIECMDQIQQNPCASDTTKKKASSIRRMLEEKSFVNWLTFFYHVMPHGDILFNELQSRIIDGVESNKYLERFMESIINIRNQEIDNIIEQTNAIEVAESNKRKRDETNWKATAIDVCDVIINVVKDRFEYIDHLNAAILFICEKFEMYDQMFPLDYFTQTINAYPVLEKQRFKTELSILYSSNEFRNISSCTALLNFLINNNLQEIFQETIKLLEILVTMPTTIVEETNLPIQKIIQKFFGGTMDQDTSNANALACLSIEQKFIQNISDFNEKIIEKIALRENKCMDFLFKS